MTTTKLWTEIEKLSTRKRLELVNRILESVPQPNPLPITPEEDAVIAERLELLDKGVKTQSWLAARSHILRKLKARRRRAS